MAKQVFSPNKLIIFQLHLSSSHYFFQQVRFKKNLYVICDVSHPVHSVGRFIWKNSEHKSVIAGIGCIFLKN
jgi:hypothetical protein